jgi:thiopeptide-type bacteriocin biosynthesis protein
VLHVLGGASLNEAAAAAQLDPTDVAEAVEIYRQAGRRALQRQDSWGWWQVYVEFRDWRTAEQTAADTIVALLRRAEQADLVSRWWFMRKYPCWRVRIHPHTDGPAMRAHLAPALDRFAADGRITRWWPGIYEAETAAFGGRDGMATAHDLFCADSRAVTGLLREGAVELGRRELSLLLCSTLMRGAGLEWYEQGDAWHRVAQERPLPEDVPVAKLTTMARDLTRLMRADTSQDGPLLGADRPLASATAWTDAFRQTGQALGEAARAATLSRGLREVLSYVVIFHWNRLGLSARTQSILAWTARAAILDLPAAGSPVPDRPATQTSPAAPPTARPVHDTERRMLVRFPLVPQRRLCCPDLRTRVRTVHECANSCDDASTAQERINRACTVWNLSALIAADCGLPDLAVELCRRQFQVFRAAAPIPGIAVIPALQPVVNLARLTRRNGDADSAFAELEAINHAIDKGSTAMIHGEHIDLDGLIADHPSTLDSWFQDIMREEGTHALIAAGQWTIAATHAQRYDQASQQLREARQTRIIAHALDGQLDTALDVLDDTPTIQPWEHAVAACLRSYVLLTGQRLVTADIAALLGVVRHARIATEPTAEMFGTRLGSVAADLAVAAESEPRPFCAELIENAIRSKDAFLARELLTHSNCLDWATPEQTGTLGTLIEQAGLGSGHIPAPMLNDLMRSIAVAKTVLATTLRTTKC